MDIYNKTAYQTAAKLTKNYSTSFSASCKLFDKSIRDDIYAIYGLVRLADEIVDSYRQSAAPQILNDLEDETYLAIKRGYSSNLIVHAFALTAKKYSIDSDLIQPFFDSMRLDIEGYKPELYEKYIYGSAQVVGLMCLKVFVAGDEKAYKKLKPGAMALGSAYQKLNFLRDMKADYEDLDRIYFPEVSFDSFDDVQKRIIEKDLARDFSLAHKYIGRLPKTARAAVKLSYTYYLELFNTIKLASVADLKNERLRVSDVKKTRLFLRQLTLKKAGL